MTPPDQRLNATGLLILPAEDGVALDEPMFGTPYQTELQDFDFYAPDPVELVAVLRPADRWPEQLFFIPALLLLLAVILLQRRRQTQPAF